MMRIFITLVLLHSIGFSVFSQSEKNNGVASENRILINEVFLYNSETDSFPRHHRKHHKIREWIEIHNGTNTKVKTRFLFLTDDLNDPAKWKIVAPKVRDQIISNNEILTVYLRGSNKKRTAYSRVDFDIDNRDLYLIKISKKDKAVTILDTLRFPENKTYPYSRYPEGGKFIHADVLTPDSENLIIKESHSEKTVGLTVHTGFSTITSETLAGSSKPTFSGGFGYFVRKSHRWWALERGFRVSVRGYGIQSRIVTPTTKGVRTLTTKGRQTIWYFDIPMIGNFHLNRNWSVLLGPVISFKVTSSLKYTQTNKFVFHSGAIEETITNYHSSETDYSLDWADLSLVMGMRYNLKRNINFSLYYIYDVGGLNASQFDYDYVQVTKGVYFATDFPLLFGKKRKKDKFILT